MSALPHRRGFSAVEIVVVLLVMSALAAIALPRLARARDKAFLATAISDLRNLASLQEVYFSGNHTFASDVATLGMRVSEGVTLEIATADGSLWEGTSVHASLRGVTCSIRVLAGTDAALAEAENFVVCTDSGGAVLEAGGGGPGNNGNRGQGNRGQGRGNQGG